MQYDLLRNPLLALFLFVGFYAKGQYKIRYSPDTLTLNQIGLFSSQELIYTGIPGLEIAIAGYVNGRDTSGQSVQSAFLLQTNSDGDPKFFSYYHDTTALFYPGARGYGLCFDGNSHFYLAVGSNDNCVIIKTDTSGNLLWAKDGGHHDFNGILYDNGVVAALGQNESFTGAHDYSITQVDEAGSSSVPDMMFGTTGFDAPRAFSKSPDGYVMTGFSASGAERRNMMVKADNNLNVNWSRVWRVVDKRMSGEDILTLPNYGGYFVTGTLESSTGGLDSIYIMKTDTGGNVLWMKSYGLENYATLFSSSLDYVPSTGNLLVGGGYKVGSFSKGYVLSVDRDGNFLWARDYANPDSLIEESISDIVVSPDGNYFFATGNYVRFDGVTLTNKIISWKAPVSNGKIDCDTSLVFGSRIAYPFDADVVFTEPFSENSPYPIVPVRNGLMNDEVICSTMVNVAEAIPDKERLRVVNPVRMEMIIDCNMDLEPGMLELCDLQGKLLLKRRVEPGNQIIRIPVSTIPEGLYFLTLRSQGSVLTTRKILIH